MMNIHVKYPRTFHLPYSPGTQSDDKKLKSDSHFHNKEIVLTLKMDGENANLTNERYWARSVDSRDHVSRNWMQNLWNMLKYDIPAGMRICGENLYAKHAIYYDALPSYFLVFNIWQDNVALSWDETEYWCSLFDLKHVPVLYRGIYNRETIESLAFSKEKVYGGDREGGVIRLVDEIAFEDWPNKAAKIVRAGHVQPNSKHWFSQPVIPNKMIFT